ncbi:sulfurtransferase TusA family protein [Halostella litorea]|uniref:sulfurtransferase TusA family protein n=1 Tax=Halostella litorea TaxID=2528831 RepID=UPI00109307CB|nr:sulfurtransferase TusA family protein [Halostella litorea]
MARVDVTGEVCPRPALIVRRELAELNAGDELVVRGDYPPAERNLRRMCRKHGFAVSDADGESADGAGADADAFELAIEVTEDADVPGA